MTNDISDDPLARYKALAWARDRFEGSLGQSFLQRLKAVDFASRAVLFGSGLLISLLPSVILLSAFASQPVDDNVSLRLGLDRKAAASWTRCSPRRQPR